MLSYEYKVDGRNVAHTRNALSACKVPMLVAALLLFFLPGGQVSAELRSGCTAYVFSPSTVYLDFPSSSFVKGTRAFYSDSACTVATGDTISAGSGWVYADAEDEAESVCQEKVSSTSTATRLWDLYPEYATANQKLWKCSGGSGGRSSGGNGKKGKYLAKKVYIPPTGVTLNQTDLKLTAVDGLNSGIQFQRVDAAGVGIPSVIELGFLDAVDVWSNIGKGYEVCFPQIGRIVFLDAATSPRHGVDGCRLRASRRLYLRRAGPGRHLGAGENRTIALTCHPATGAAADELRDHDDAPTEPARCGRRGGCAVGDSS